MSTFLRIALVGCGARKLDGAHPAGELYIGPLFRGGLEYALARYPREQVLVLSARHGLLSLDTVAASYNLHLGELDAETREAWAGGVARELRRLFPVESASVEVLASALYVDTLRPHLPPGWEVVAPLAGLTMLECRKWLRQARASLAAPAVLRVPALGVEQSPGRRLYLFSVDGKQVPRFATVSRVRRAGGQLQGYQRPEVLSHVQAIREYMESAAPLVPNAVVLAFDSRVRFEPLAPGAAHGHLVIPLVDGEGAPAFIVDGQQRLAAVREAEVASFPLACSAFITDDVGQQAEQFILVNSTKPLPKGLIYELLPSTRGALPDALERRRLPAALVERLNLDAGSPLKGLIKTLTNPGGLAQDNSFLRALENSLRDGVLYRFAELPCGPDVEGMLALLRAWWAAVASTWPKAWARPPKESRLLHGAGVVALSLLLDEVDVRLRAEPGQPPPSAADFGRELKVVAAECRWTDGVWDFGPGRQRRWNELQNTSKDVELLSSFLSVTYRERSKDKPVRKPRARKAGVA